MKVKKYIKKLYIEEAYCDMCGHPMTYSGMVLTTFPPQYNYVCTNKRCGNTTSFTQNDKPDTLKFEFEEKTINIVKKTRLEEQKCPCCNEILEAEACKSIINDTYYVYYTCPNGCELEKNYEKIEDESNSLIYYVEEDSNVSNNCPYGRVWRG